LYEAHNIAEAVHSGLEKNFPLVKHITVHVNPYTDDDKNKTVEEVIEEPADNEQIENEQKPN